jgi:protein translocase SecG subunit
MQALNVILLILATIIIVLVTIQAKGTGLSIVPGSNDFGKFERRGPEKTLHQATILLVSVFVVISIYSYFVS